MSELPARRGWRAELELRLQSLDGRTRITHRLHSGPLLVQRAFYPERDSACSEPFRGGRSPVKPASEPCHVYLIHPPGGVAGGDELDLRVHVGPAAHALLTTPAAGKFYRRGCTGGAQLSQTLSADDGVLEWCPQENIFYPDAAVEVSTRVHLSGSARFIGWEITCLGLPACGLPLQSGGIRQRFELWHDQRPRLIERLMLDEACRVARWGLAGHAAIGTWLAYPAGTHELEIARARAAKYCAKIALACTLVDDVLICRGHAERADRLKQAFIDLWSAARPALVARQPVPPRIWAT